jgi:hypothetical protein
MHILALDSKAYNIWCCVVHSIFSSLDVLASLKNVHWTSLRYCKSLRRTVNLIKALLAEKGSTAIVIYMGGSRYILSSKMLKYKNYLLVSGK